jgi:hypothetical protein
MIDALLYSVRDSIRAAPYGYGKDSCDIRDDGHPKPNCGAVFVSVHQSPSQSTNDNCLMELFGWQVTLSMRLEGIPYDRIGDQMLAVKLAKASGFNRRCEQLRAFLHMNWGIIGLANNYLAEMVESEVAVGGFCEPARYRGMENPVLDGAMWFCPETPETATQRDQGLHAALTFAGAKRFQPLGTYA